MAEDAEYKEGNQNASSSILSWHYISQMLLWTCLYGHRLGHYRDKRKEKQIKKVRDNACSPVHWALSWAQLCKAYSWWSHSRTCERLFTGLCSFQLSFSSSSVTHFEISWKLKHLSSTGTLFSHGKYAKQKISLLQRSSVEKTNQSRDAVQSKGPILLITICVFI